MQELTRQGRMLRRMSGALSAVLVLGASVAMAQQQVAPPLIKGVDGSETKPAPAAATKLAAISAVMPKTMADMVYGGQAAMTGASDGKGKLGEEGMKMHGHWVIDVKNLDGSLASHHDFENSVQIGGQAYLIGLMAGYVVPADYEIFLQNTGSGAAPCTASLQGCAIVHSTTTQPGFTTCSSYLCSTSLTYAYSVSGTANSSMVLSGQITANQAGTVAYVSTYAGSCPNIPSQTTLGTVTPAACSSTPANSSGFNALTGTFLGSPISVASGQVISVTVTISFS